MLISQNRNKSDYNFKQLYPRNVSTYKKYLNLYLNRYFTNSGNCGIL